MMMRFLLIVLVFPCFLFGQGSLEVMKPINDYIEGTTYNYPEKIIESFIPGGQMFLHNTADTLMIWSVEKYAALYDNGRRGQENKRYTKSISLDIVEHVAYAKLEVDIPSFSMRFFDLLLLKKIDDQWKIISKCAEAIPLPKTPEEAKPSPVKEIVLDGLKRPWSMAFLSAKDVLIAEKDGSLLMINLETKERQEVKGLPDDVAGPIQISETMVRDKHFPSDAAGTTQSYNAGLFQVLLHPDFGENKIIYLSYASENVEKESALKVIKTKLENGELNSIETILLADPYSQGLFHYGGGMTIAGDHLYISTGERNLYEEKNPPLPLSQDVSDPRGKIFRFNLDGSIPDDNPEYGDNAVPGLYALGIRAAQGLTTHSETGEVWFSEHGTIQGDEINKLEAGANYGWPYETSGSYRSRNYAPDQAEGLKFVNPVHFWSQTVAPTGLTFYYGREFPQWQGSLIVPGLSKGSLWRMELKNETVVTAEELFINERVRLRKTAMSPDGHLYLLTDEENGKLIRVINQ